MTALFHINDSKLALNIFAKFILDNSKIDFFNETIVGYYHADDARFQLTVSEEQQIEKEGAVIFYIKYNPYSEVNNWEFECNVSSSYDSSMQIIANAVGRAVANRDNPEYKAYANPQLSEDLTVSIASLKAITDRAKRVRKFAADQAENTLVDTLDATKSRKVF